MPEHSASKPLIKAQNVCYAHAQTQVLSNISLEVYPQEVVTLIGPNGAGKSTLLKILLGLSPPSQGKVSRKSALRVGFMPQHLHIDPTLPMKVKRFLTLGLAMPQPSQGNSTGWFRRVFKKNKYSTTTLQQIAKELNIEALLNHPIQKVSGGEMQRILLARALLRQPELLVLDEPVQGIDLQGQNEMYQYIDKVRHHYQCTILMVSHDLHIVMKQTDKVLCLNQHLCCSGHPKTVSESPEFRALFGELGESLAVYEHHHSEQCQTVHGANALHTQNKET